MDVEWLLEAFDSSVPYKWEMQKRSYSMGRFDVDGVRYTVIVDRVMVDEDMDDYFDDLAEKAAAWGAFYDVQFTAQQNGIWTYTSTGTGNQWKVYSTVVAMVNDCMEKFGALPIHAGAEDPKRRSLYPKMLGRLLPGWSVVSMGEKILAVPGGA